MKQKRIKLKNKKTGKTRTLKKKKKRLHKIRKVA